VLHTSIVPSIRILVLTYTKHAVGSYAGASRLPHTFTDSLCSLARHTTHTGNGVDYTGKGCKLSRWTLTADHVQDDITIAVNVTSGEQRVRISAAAFAHATPQVVTLDGVRGAFFSKRLYHAVVRFITKDGTDTKAVEHIMNTRFGCSIESSPPMNTAQYTALTAATTAEDGGRFQMWSVHPKEPLLILEMFEELPQVRTCYCRSFYSDIWC
jgi:hypothetical protein